MENKNVNDMTVREIKERITYIENIRSVLAEERNKLSYSTDEIKIKELNNIISLYYPELEELKSAINLGDHIKNIEEYKYYDTNFNGQPKYVIACETNGRVELVKFLLERINDVVHDAEIEVEFKKDYLSQELEGLKTEEGLNEIEELKEYLLTVKEIKETIKDNSQKLNTEV